LFLCVRNGQFIQYCLQLVVFHNEFILRYDFPVNRSVTSIPRLAISAIIVIVLCNTLFTRNNNLLKRHKHQGKRHSLTHLFIALCIIHRWAGLVWDGITGWDTSPILFEFTGEGAGVLIADVICCFLHRVAIVHEFNCPFLALFGKPFLGALAHLFEEISLQRAHRNAAFLCQCRD